MQQITLDLILPALRLKICIIVSFFTYLWQITLCIVFKRVISYRFGIALLLLISFSATQFPLGLFHNHSDVIVCNDYPQGKDICQHKSHLATKKDHCLACSIHVEKVFLFNTPFPENDNCNGFLAYHLSSVAVHSNTPQHTTLRGPPSIIT